MARQRSSSSETPGLSAIALGLTQSVNKEVKQVDTGGASLGVSQSAVELGTSMGEFLRGEDASTRLKELETSIGEAFEGSNYKNIGDLRAWYEANSQRDDLSPEEVFLVQAHYDVLDAVTLATLASTGRMGGDVVDALGDSDPNGRTVEEALGIGEDSPLAGLGEMMIDVAILDNDYVGVLEDFNRAVVAGDYRGGVNEALRSMGSKELKSPGNPEWDMIMMYLHEMRAATDFQNKDRKGVPLRPKIPAVGAEAGEGPGGTEYDSPYKVTRDSFARALKDGGQMRFDALDLPEWANHDEIDDARERVAARERDIVMAKIHDIAERKGYYGDSDFGKMRTSSGFEIKQKELAIYFDRRTQMAGQIMVGDLMDFHTKKNGVKMLTFKLGEDGLTPTKYVSDRVKNMSLYVDEVALRSSLYENTKRLENETEGAFRDRIKMISNDWFDRALENKKEFASDTLKFPVEVSHQNRLAAYSMREFMFISLAFSQADRTRMFTPLPRLIQDPERFVIWPGQKLNRKVGADVKKGRAPNMMAHEAGQYKAETATAVQLWVQEAMDIEDVLGKPLDNTKFVAQKVQDGEIVLGPESLCISFMDILPVKVTVEENGVPVEKTVTLAEALKDALFFDPGRDDADVMAGFRDVMEQGGDAFAYFKGEVPFPWGKGSKEIADWRKKRNKVLGLTRDVSQNGKPLFTDVLRDPKLIETLMLGCFGVDPVSIAVGRPTILCPVPGYEDDFIDIVVDAMGLMADWANPREVKNVLKGLPAKTQGGFDLTKPFGGVKYQVRRMRAAGLIEEYNKRRDSVPQRN